MEFLSLLRRLHEVWLAVLRDLSDYKKRFFRRGGNAFFENRKSLVNIG